MLQNNLASLRGGSNQAQNALAACSETTGVHVGASTLPFALRCFKFRGGFNLVSHLI